MNSAILWALFEQSDDGAPRIIIKNGSEMTDREVWEAYLDSLILVEKRLGNVRCPSCDDLGICGNWSLIVEPPL